jgi:hypothetical protein
VRPTLPYRVLPDAGETAEHRGTHRSLRRRAIAALGPGASPRSRDTKPGTVPLRDRIGHEAVARSRECWMPMKATAYGGSPASVVCT